jgi:thiamine-monophosphate kinase
MGARPRAAVVALTLDPRTRTDWLEKFYRGLAACARAHRVAIVGGDIAQAGHGLAASLTLVGEATGARMLTRAGARLGDWIFVTGPLGGSLLGKHHRFTPRLAEGAWLAARPEVRAMMDLSDGLAKDIHALTPRDAQPLLATADIPISAAAKKRAAQTGRAPLDHALGDGEDFELLFAVRRDADLDRLRSGWRRHFGSRLHCIGCFGAAGRLPPGMINLQAHHGYEHLR